MLRARARWPVDQGQAAFGRARDERGLDSAVLGDDGASLERARWSFELASERARD